MTEVTSKNRCKSCHGQGFEPHEMDDGRLVSGPACERCGGSGEEPLPAALADTDLHHLVVTYGRRFDLPYSAHIVTALKELQERRKGHETKSLQGLKSISFEPRGSQFALIVCFDSIEHARAARPVVTNALLERKAVKATPDAYKAACEGGSGGPCTQPDCETCWPDEEVCEHLYVPRSSGNDQCMACGKPKSECSAVNGSLPQEER